jgi:hypothetical protein
MAWLARRVVQCQARVAEPGRAGARVVTPGSLALILVCTGLGIVTGRNPDTGAWLVEAAQR